MSQGNTYTIKIKRSKPRNPDWEILASKHSSPHQPKKQRAKDKRDLEREVWDAIR